MILSIFKQQKIQNMSGRLLNKGRYGCAVNCYRFWSVNYEFMFSKINIQEKLQSLHGL